MYDKQKKYSSYGTNYDVAIRSGSQTNGSQAVSDTSTKSESSRVKRLSTKGSSSSSDHSPNNQSPRILKRLGRTARVIRRPDRAARTPNHHISSMTDSSILQDISERSSITEGVASMYELELQRRLRLEKPFSNTPYAKLDKSHEPITSVPKEDELTSTASSSSGGKEVERVLKLNSGVLKNEDTKKTEQEWMNIDDEVEDDLAAAGDMVLVHHKFDCECKECAEFQISHSSQQHKQSGLQDNMFDSSSSSDDMIERPTKVRSLRKTKSKGKGKGLLYSLTIRSKGSSSGQSKGSPSSGLAKGSPSAGLSKGSPSSGRSKDSPASGRAKGSPSSSKGSLLSVHSKESSHTSSSRESSISKVQKYAFDNGGFQ